VTISVVINLPVGASLTVAVPAPDPASWTKDDAKEFVWAVWRLLKAHAGESLQLKEIDPASVVYRLEFVADSGSAVAEPLSLSMAALVFLQTLRFDLSPGGPVH
jgi:hypothetical protein